MLADLSSEVAAWLLQLFHVTHHLQQWGVADDVHTAVGVTTQCNNAAA